MTSGFDIILAGLHDSAELTDQQDTIQINENRKLIFPEGYNTVVAHTGDVNSQIVTFDIPQFHEGHNLHNCTFKQVVWKNVASGISGVSNLIQTEGATTFQWLLPPQLTQSAGIIKFTISCYDLDANNKLAFSWNTPTNTDLSIGRAQEFVGLPNEQLPAKNEILYIHDNKQIVAPKDYNNIVALYGDTGTSKVYFQTHSVIKGIDVLAATVRILVNFNDITTSAEIVDKKEIFLEDSEQKEVLFTWTLPGWLTNGEENFSGTFTISLVFEQDDKKWSTAPFSRLSIGNTLIDSFEQDLQERPDLSDIIKNLQFVTDSVDTKELRLNIGYNSQANGEQSIAGGRETVSGMRGYRIKDIPSRLPFDATTTNIQMNLDSVDGLVVGDIVSFATFDEQANEWRPNIDNGTILDISGKSVVINAPTKLSNIYNGITIESHLAYKIGVKSKPHLGTTSIAGRTTALGYKTKALGDGSVAEGIETQAIGEAQHVQGKYNAEDPNMAHIVGGGVANNARKNIHTLDWEGNAWFAGDVRIAGKGGLSEAYDEIQAMQKRIRWLELANEGNTYVFDTVTERAFKRLIPSNSLPYALIDKVGGMSTYETALVNEIDLAFTETTVNGVTLSYNADTREITINGTATDAIYEVDSTVLFTGVGFALQREDGTLYDWQYEVVSGSKDDGGWFYFMGDGGTGEPSMCDVEELPSKVGVYPLSRKFCEGSYMYFSKVIGIAFDCPSGTVFNNYTIRFDIGAEKTAMQYAVPTAIKVHGKNLIPDTFYNYSNWTKSGSWLAFDISHIFPTEGTYTVKVLKNPNMTWGENILGIQQSKDGANWGTPDDMTSSYLLSSGVLAGQKGVSIKFAKGDKYRLRIYPQKQEVLDKLLNLQIEYGSTATDYAPYTENIISIKDLLGDGLALDENTYNYIDFEAKELVLKVGSRAYQSGDLDNTEVATDGVKTIYRLDTEAREDISASLPADNFIAVEPNGYIAIEVDNKGGASKAATSTITYQLKL